MGNLTIGAPPRPRHRTAIGLMLALLLAGIVPSVVTGAAAASPADDFPTPAAGSPWFGGELDWDNDDAAKYTKRLGSSVSLLARSIDYPLTANSMKALSDLAAQTRGQRAIAVLSLLPTGSLGDLDDADATELVETLNALSGDLGTRFLVRFAPEMNGTWTSYGQQPTAYVDAFTALANVIHSEGDSIQTVWSPAYGGGYPFGGSINDPVRGAVVSDALSETDEALLDTNNNQRLDATDDPYGPYYPGEQAVDWVGLSMLRYNDGTTLATNTLAGKAELQLRLDDRFGYPSTGRPSFYQRYAVVREKPMLLLTGAAYSAEAAEDGGPTERAVKGTWLRRVLSAAKSRSQIGAVVWLEATRPEPEVGGVVRWGLTSSPALGRALGRTLTAGSLDLGPVAGSPADATAEEADDLQGATSDSSSDNVLESAANAIGLTMVQVSLLLLILIVSLTMWLTWRVRQQRMRPPWG